MLTMIVAIGALAALNVAYKGIGPALLGDRTFPPRTQAVVDALPAALLAGLLVVDLLGQRWRDLDPTMLPGLAVAVALRHAGRSHPVCIVAGVVVTAAARALTGR